MYCFICLWSEHLQIHCSMTCILRMLTFVLFLFFFTLRSTHWCCHVCSLWLHLLWPFLDDHLLWQFGTRPSTTNTTVTKKIQVCKCSSGLCRIIVTLQSHWELLIPWYGVCNRFSYYQFQNKIWTHFSHYLCGGHWQWPGSLPVQPVAHTGLFPFCLTLVLETRVSQSTCIIWFTC